MSILLKAQVKFPRYSTYDSNYVSFTAQLSWL